MFPDSFDKIVDTYFVCIATQNFEYKGKLYKPKQLRISPSLTTITRCPPQCGGCCPRFSLDYLPDEARPTVQRRTVWFNGKEFYIFSDIQTDQKSHHCGYVSMDRGRCTIYDYRPFTCRFETLRFKKSEDPRIPNLLGNYPFGRGWLFKRTDGGKGARCIFTHKKTEKSTYDAIGKLLQLQRWAKYFNLANKIDDIIRKVQYNTKNPFII